MDNEIFWPESSKVSWHQQYNGHTIDWSTRWATNQTGSNNNNNNNTDSSTYNMQMSEYASRVVCVPQTIASVDVRVDTIKWKLTQLIKEAQLGSSSTWSSWNNTTYNVVVRAHHKWAHSIEIKWCGFDTVSIVNFDNNNCHHHHHHHQHQWQWHTWQWHKANNNEILENQNWSTLYNWLTVRNALLNGKVGMKSSIIVIIIVKKEEWRFSNWLKSTEWF